MGQNSVSKPKPEFLCHILIHCYFQIQVIAIESIVNRDRSCSMYAKFSEKLTFLTPN